MGIRGGQTLGCSLTTKHASRAGLCDQDTRLRVYNAFPMPADEFALHDLDEHPVKHPAIGAPIGRAVFDLFNTCYAALPAVTDPRRSRDDHLRGNYGRFSTMGSSRLPSAKQAGAAHAVTGLLTPTILKFDETCERLENGDSPQIESVTVQIVNAGWGKRLSLEYVDERGVRV